MATVSHNHAHYQECLDFAEHILADYLGLSATDNLLYDPATGRITALIDYDFASISRPAYEFFRSFAGTGGQLTGWLGDTTAEEKEATALRNAKLTGQYPSPFPSPVASVNGPGVDWELAQVWED
ncbi:hypothetical protein F4802DRAFT_594710 [Xylaria palmicola]|nr:hypothetical protein F4802DRAFT_594710 [Xylaria palmicola]